MKTRNLIRSCFRGKNNLLALAIFLLVFLATLISFMHIDTDYVNNEILSLKNEFGSLDNVPRELYEQVTQPEEDFIDGILLMMGFTFSLAYFPSMFRLSLQNGISRKSFIKAFSMLCFVGSVIYAVIGTAVSVAGNSFAKYSLLTTFLERKISGFFGFTGLASLLVGSVCIIVEFLTADLVGLLMSIMMSKYGLLKGLSIFAVCMCFAVSSLIFIYMKFIDAFAVVLIIYILILAFCCFRMSRTLSLENDVFEEV